VEIPQQGLPICSGLVDAVTGDGAIRRLQAPAQNRRLFSPEGSAYLAWAFTIRVHVSGAEPNKLLVRIRLLMACGQLDQAPAGPPLAGDAKWLNPRCTRRPFQRGRCPGGTVVSASVIAPIDSVRRSLNCRISDSSMRWHVETICEAAGVIHRGSGVDDLRAGRIGDGHPDEGVLPIAGIAVGIRRLDRHLVAGFRTGRVH
jgi:hypothetical protein